MNGQRLRRRPRRPARDHLRHPPDRRASALTLFAAMTAAIEAGGERLALPLRTQLMPRAPLVMRRSKRRPTGCRCPRLDA